MRQTAAVKVFEVLHDGAGDGPAGDGTYIYRSGNRRTAEAFAPGVTIAGPTRKNVLGDLRFILPWPSGRYISIYMDAVTLYRAAAAESPYFGAESCWTADRETAEAYRDNGGYGGPVVYVATVEIDEARALDLTGIPSAKIARRLATVLGLRGDDRDAAEGRWGQQHKAWAPWETVASLRDALAERYDWIVYDDDYPEGAVTWCYLGEDEVEAQRA